MYLIIQNGFWVVHIPFINMDKFQFLAQFPAIVSSRIFFLCYFAYCVISRFVSITTKSTSTILLRLIYFCMNIFGPYGVVCATIRRDSVSLLMFPFLSHVLVFPCEMSSVCRLKYPYSCFSSHTCFVVIVLLNFMLSMLFLVTVIRLSLLFWMHSSGPRGWRVFYLLLFLIHIVYVISSLAFLSSGPFVWGLPSSISRMVPIILQIGQPRCFSF